MTRAEKKRRKYIAAARRLYEGNGAGHLQRGNSTDDIEIDNDAKLSVADEDNGAWVQAWVWVHNEEVARR
jgi:hypothetical protein